MSKVTRPLLRYFGGKWQASVEHKGKNHYLGLFVDRDKAGEVAEAKRRELNFLCSESAASLP